MRIYELFGLEVNLVRKASVSAGIRNRRRIWYKDWARVGTVSGVQFQLFDEFDNVDVGRGVQTEVEDASRPWSKTNVSP